MDAARPNKNQSVLRIHPLVVVLAAEQKELLARNAAALILVHNHHLIAAGTNVLSFAERGPM